MSNSKTTRQENLNKYADMLHRQNVSGGQPKPGEVKITKPFEETIEKETKMSEQQTKLEPMSMEEALGDQELAALSANVLKECYQLIRAKIADNLLDEHKAEITEECTDESMTAMRSYLATLSKEETQKLVSDVVKELVNGQLFNTISEIVQETEEKLEESDVKVDLMEEAKKAIIEKAEEIEEKASEKIKEATETEESKSEESVENTESTATDVSESDVADVADTEKAEESSDAKGIVWPMNKFSEMFPEKVEEKTESN
jgi:hypothetical protein